MLYAVAKGMSKGNEEFEYAIACDEETKNRPVCAQSIIIPSHIWVKFTCIGPNPGAIQSINSKVFENWLPGNTEYQLADDISIELHSIGDSRNVTYQSEIWIPINKKEEQ